MNLMRNASRRLGRGQSPLLRQYWLHRTLRQRPEDGEGEGAANEGSPLTENGEAAPDDQT